MQQGAAKARRREKIRVRQDNLPTARRRSVKVRVPMSAGAAGCLATTSAARSLPAGGASREHRAACPPAHEIESFPAAAERAQDTWVQRRAASARTRETSGPSIFTA